MMTEHATEGVDGDTQSWLWVANTETASNGHKVVGEGARAFARSGDPVDLSFAKDELARELGDDTALAWLDANLVRAGISEMNKMATPYGDSGRRLRTATLKGGERAPDATHKT